MDTANDRPNKTLNALRTGAGALALSIALLASPHTEARGYSFGYGGLLPGSLLVASGGVAISVKAGSLQQVLLAGVTVSVATSVLRASFSRNGILSLQSQDGTQTAEFDIPPERLKAAGVKSGDPVEVHRGPAGWRLAANGVDLAFVVEESGAGLLTSVRR